MKVKICMTDAEDSYFPASREGEEVIIFTPNSNTLVVGNEEIPVKEHKFIGYGILVATTPDYQKLRFEFPQ